MQVTAVKVSLSGEDIVRAHIDITLNGRWVIHDLKIIQHSAGYLVAMPTKHYSDGSSYTIAFPTTEEARRMIETAVMAEFEKAAANFPPPARTIPSSFGPRLSGFGLTSCGGGNVKLRDHPGLSFHGVCSWPPVWLSAGGKKKTRPRGEIAILKEVTLSSAAPRDLCLLAIEDEGAEYMGTLPIEDASFCRAIYRILLKHLGRSIKEIGDIDLGYTL